MGKGTRKNDRWVYISGRSNHMNCQLEDQNRVSVVDAIPYVIKPPVRDLSTHSDSTAAII